MTTSGFSCLPRPGGHFASPISNLREVVRLIESGANDDLSSAWQPFAGGEIPDSRDSVDSSTSVTSAPRDRVAALKLHVEEEPDEFWERSDETAGSQVEQLVVHVRNRKRDLDQREANLQADVYRWEQEVMKVKAELNRRTNEVEQQRQQFNLQRAQLIKLQQNLVTTQMNLRAIVEKIVDQCQPQELKLELGKLRFELTESMDGLLRRWETLRKNLESR
jgi:chromosome segregation ATPase